MKMKDNSKSLIYSGVLSLIVLIIIMILKNVYPFGDNTFAYFDDGQYISYYSYSVNSLFNNDNMLYSWGNVLGGNMLSLAAFYCISPLNILLVFFRNNILVGFQFVTIIRTVLLAVSFCYLLNYLKHGYICEKAIFAVSYAFCGYAITHIWNSTWIDAMILLPLVVLGEIKLIKKQQPITYIVFLGLACFMNFYMGFMICLASVIAYISINMAIAENGFLKQTSTNAIWYIMSSIIAGGLAAITLLPAYFGLPKGRQNNIMDGIKETYTTFDLRDFFSEFFSGITKTNLVRGDGVNVNQPLVFIGMFCLAMFFSLFVNNKVSFRKKMAAGFVFLVMLLSFRNWTFNLLWHGFSAPNCYCYRYSYVLSFFMITIAFYAYTNIDKETIKKLIPVIVLFMIYTLESVRPEMNTHSMWFDILFMIVSIYCVYMSISKTKKFIAVLTIVVCLNMIGNAYQVLEDGINDSWKISSFSQINDATKDAIANIDDQGIYRTESNANASCSNAMMYSYAGVTNYASSEDVSTLSFVKSLGYTQGWMDASYRVEIPKAIDSLIGIKYLIENNGTENKYETIYSNDILNLEYNANALPIALLTNRKSNEMEQNIFDQVNDYYLSINGIQSMEETPFISYKLVENNETQSLNNVYSCSVQILKDGYLHLTLKPNYYTITVSNNDNMVSFDATNRVAMYRLGYFRAGETVNVTISTLDESSIESSSISLATELESSLEAYVQTANMQEVSVDKRSSSHLVIDTFADEDCNYLALSIPYDDAWNIKVDGVKVKSDLNMGRLMVVPVEAGHHIVELKYYPKGFVLGLVVTSVSLIFTIVLWVLIRKYDKNFMA